MAEVTLTVVGSELEAEMLCGLLRTNGIACTYRITDLAAGMADASYAKGGPREILVESSQLEEARKLLPDGPG
jgi:Putative prokaryotic signal transducing protein